jgi:hypothetical protein
VHHFVEPYLAPYLSKHHYWTGLLLLARVVIYLTISLNGTGDPSTNLLVIIVITIKWSSIPQRTVWTSLSQLENRFNRDGVLREYSSLQCSEIVYDRRQKRYSFCIHFRFNYVTTAILHLGLPHYTLLCLSMSLRQETQTKDAQKSLGNGCID